jgi:hypothetical protein
MNSGLLIYQFKEKKSADENKYTGIHTKKSTIFRSPPLESFS